MAANDDIVVLDYEDLVAGKDLSERVAKAYECVAARRRGRRRRCAVRRLRRQRASEQGDEDEP